MRSIFILICILSILPIGGCHKGPVQPSPPQSYKIAFTSALSGSEEIYIMNMDGSDQRQLTHGLATGGRAAWSPDGEKILFVSGESPEFSLSIVNVEGTNQHAVTQLNPDYKAYYDFPVWSPDGARIAFVDYQGGNVDLYVMNTDGSGRKILTDNPAPDRFPHWSPDGSKIAYVSWQDVNGEICMVNANGTGHQRLTEKTLWGDMTRHPKWSPYSTKILFTNTQGRQMQHLMYVIHSDGANLHPLNSTPIGLQGLAWMPDGDEIVYCMDTFVAEDESFMQEIYKIKVDGSHNQRIFEMATPGYCVSWSQDGSRIVFVANGQAGGAEIFTINSDGTEIQQLTTHGLCDDPQWRPVPSL